MDDSRKTGSSRVIALVVRQFAPSRIERQLLAQVFDLVCCEPSPIACSSAEQTGDHHATAQSVYEWSTEPQFAGRATA